MKRGLAAKRFLAPLVALLTQGTSAENIALSLALGLALGVFPVLGSTTLLCTGAAWIFRLNLPAIQLVNYLSYPLQLLLLVPLIRLGEMLFRAAPLHLSLAQMLEMAHANLPHAITILWRAGVQAISAWLLLAPPAVFCLYFLLSRLLRKIAASSGAVYETESSI